MSPIAVRFRNVSLDFGELRALDGVDLEIEEGEFFGILGPSGSGKTSCLRLIAGFEQPSRGEIELHGELATDQLPYERDVNTVFQDYALFGHMSVAENVAYGLMVKGVARRERARRTEEMLELVRLGGFGGRRPTELSGGQRQRVALARALINRPRLLLLDEPLGALDLKLRQQMQVELRTLQRNLGITFVFVTHDQGEALSMSDRLAVFNEGRIEQVAAPQDVYERPSTRFAAEFVGDSNVLDTLTGSSAELLSRCGVPRGVFSLRPEKLRLLTTQPATEASLIAVAGEVVDLQFHGASVRCVVALTDGSSMIATAARGGEAASGGEMSPRGARVWAAWRVADMHPLAEPGSQSDSKPDSKPGFD